MNSVIKVRDNTNPSLLNLITPIGLELKRNSLIIGENTGRIYGVVTYPQKVDYGWLSKITNILGTVVGITFIPIDNGEFISGLSRSIIQRPTFKATSREGCYRWRKNHAPNRSDG